MVRSMMRLAASSAVAAVALAGCSTPATSPGGPPTTVASTTSTTTAAAPATSGRTAGATTARLVIPGKVKGEVSRTILHVAGVDVPGGTSSIWDPVKGRSYLVKSACVSTDPGLLLTYRLVDPRPSGASLPLEERTVMASQVRCDGSEHVDGVGTLLFPVIVEFDETQSAVLTAYSIVVPG
jgi:hypothetical protein